MKTYTHLTLAERKIVSAMRQEKHSVRRIAETLGRDTATISREVRRNALTPGHYDVEKADRKARHRRHQSKKPVVMIPPVMKEVYRHLIEFLSPEQISHKLRQAGNPVSHETIYRHIWEDRANGGTWYRCLRHSQKQRRKRYGRYDSRGRLAGKRMIDKRPAQIETRQEIGHWEADTVLGRGSKHCIVTLVERKTGYTLIGKVPARTVENVNARILKMFRHRGDLPLRSITVDNGTEFHGYRVLEEHLGIPIYFANPYHSWERGTNENTNGLIRQYLPKRQSMAKITQQDCNRIANALNQRPRKRHGFVAPEELIYAQ